jgi:CubicO group peptidase (beta-lactamase class C family)
MPRVLTLALAIVMLVSLQQRTAAQISAQPSLALNLFEQYLEQLRRGSGIPGLSAAILQDGQTIWDRGLGMRDLEASLPAQADTPYPIADLTQTFTSVMLLTCVEYGLVDLDSPIALWMPTTTDGGTTLRQLLAHAAPPGAPSPYRYDPGRFASLGAPVESCGKQPYRKLLAQYVLDRLAMFDAVPGRDIATMPDDIRELFAATSMERYASAVSRLAVPYKVDKRGRASRSEFPATTGINASSGLIASVRDLARYDAGLATLLSEETLAASWTNAHGPETALPTGLGWFVQSYNGERLVWHFGLTADAYSSLILKVPARRLTLILLANSDGLSAPFSLDKGDVTSSPFAKAFLRLFL